MSSTIIMMLSIRYTTPFFTAIISIYPIGCVLQGADRQKNESCSFFDKLFLKPQPSYGQEVKPAIYIEANANTNRFVSAISVLTVSITIVFPVLCSIFFLSLYTSRRKEMDKELIVRDHMLDLLVTNTSNAFALLSPGQEKPQYISSNMMEITDMPSVRLRRFGKGFAPDKTGIANPEYINPVNQQMAQWQGRSEFISPYMKYRDSIGRERYFNLRIYAAPKKAARSS